MSTAAVHCTKKLMASSCKKQLLAAGIVPTTPGHVATVTSNRQPHFLNVWRAQPIPSDKVSDPTAIGSNQVWSRSKLFSSEPVCFTIFKKNFFLSVRSKTCFLRFALHEKVFVRNWAELRNAEINSENGFMIIAYTFIWDYYSSILSRWIIIECFLWGWHIDREHIQCIG